MDPTLGEDRVLTVVLGGLGCPVVGLELGQRDKPDLAVQASQPVQHATPNASGTRTEPEIETRGRA